MGQRLHYLVATWTGLTISSSNLRIYLDWSLAGRFTMDISGYCGWHITTKLSLGYKRRSKLFYWSLARPTVANNLWTLSPTNQSRYWLVWSLKQSNIEEFPNLEVCKEHPCPAYWQIFMECVSKWWENTSQAFKSLGVFIEWAVRNTFVTFHTTGWL